MKATRLKSIRELIDEAEQRQRERGEASEAWIREMLRRIDDTGAGRPEYPDEGSTYLGNPSLDALWLAVALTAATTRADEQQRRAEGLAASVLYLQQQYEALRQECDRRDARTEGAGALVGQLRHGLTVLLSQRAHVPAWAQALLERTDTQAAARYRAMVAVVEAARQWFACESRSLPEKMAANDLFDALAALDQSEQETLK